jgi:hypothetical protein
MMLLRSMRPFRSRCRPFDRTKCRTGGIPPSARRIDQGDYFVIYQGRAPRHLSCRRRRTDRDKRIKAGAIHPRREAPRPASTGSVNLADAALIGTDLSRLTFHHPSQADRPLVLAPFIFQNAVSQAPASRQDALVVPETSASPQPDGRSGFASCNKMSDTADPHPRSDRSRMPILLLQSAKAGCAVTVASVTPLNRTDQAATADQTSSVTITSRTGLSRR